MYADKDTFYSFASYIFEILARSVFEEGRISNDIQIYLNLKSIVISFSHTIFDYIDVT